MSAQTQLIPDASALANDLGFKPAARGSRARGGITLRTERNWTVLTHRKPFLGDPLGDLLGAPGLWRAVPSAGPGTRSKVRTAAWSYVFEIPPGAADTARSRPAIARSFDPTPGDTPE